MYTSEGLSHGIERCRHNIDVLKDAIARERDTIKQYKAMIDTIRREGKAQAQAQKNVHIELVTDDGQPE